MADSTTLRDCTPSDRPQEFANGLFFGSATPHGRAATHFRAQAGHRAADSHSAIDEVIFSRCPLFDKRGKQPRRRDAQPRCAFARRAITRSCTAACRRSRAFFCGQIHFFCGGIHKRGLTPERVTSLSFGVVCDSLRAAIAQLGERQRTRGFSAPNRAGRRRHTALEMRVQVPSGCTIRYASSSCLGATRK